MGAQTPGVAQQIAEAQAALEALRERTRALSAELAGRVRGTVERTGQMIEKVQAVVETPAKVKAYVDDHRGAFELVGLGLAASVAGLFGMLTRPAPRRLPGRARLLLGDGRRLRGRRRGGGGATLVALAFGLGAALLAERWIAGRRR